MSDTTVGGTLRGVVETLHAPVYPAVDAATGETMYVSWVPVEMDFLDGPDPYVVHGDPGV